MRQAFQNAGDFATTSFKNGINHLHEKVTNLFNGKSLKVIKGVTYTTAALAMALNQKDPHEALGILFTTSFVLNSATQLRQNAVQAYQTAQNTKDWRATIKEATKDTAMIAFGAAAMAGVPVMPANISTLMKEILGVVIERIEGIQEKRAAPPAHKMGM